MHIRDLTRILFDRFFSLSFSPVVETQFSRAYGKSRVSPIRICHFWCDFFPSPHTEGGKHRFTRKHRVNDSD